MNFKQLEIIDFSQGIRSSEVMNNDLSLQSQIERERLSIAGYGVNYGLELSLSDDFNIDISEGTLIDNEGKEKYIEGSKENIEKPLLVTKKEKIYSEEDGRIILSETPYSTTRLYPSQYAEKKYWNIEIYYEDNSSIVINISSIDGNILYTDVKNSKRAVIVKYTVAYDRIDTVYVDKEYNIKLKYGISSLTPSSYIPEDCKYILGFIKISSMVYNDEENIYEAKISIIKEFNNRRMVYTDSENNLYLCGVPFESLLKIYFTEPLEPKEGMLWYDMKTNKLKIWRRTDNFVFTDIYTYTSSNPNDRQAFATSVGYFKNQLSVYIQDTNYTEDIWKKLKNEEIEYYTDLEESEKEKKESFEFRIVPKVIKGTKIKYTINRYDESYYWVPINDTSYIPVSEYKMWCPDAEGQNLLEYKPGLNISELSQDRNNHDLKHFIFKSSELHLRYTPYKNELNILIDQIPLHRDQFSEITVNDVLQNQELTNIAINSYGYTLKMLEELENSYLDLGIGFKLTNRLDRPCFIEVGITHRVNDSILRNKLQRNSVFAKSETIVFSSILESLNLITINTAIPFKYGEEQIDVYINGTLVKKELVTENSTEKILGAHCKSFTLDKNTVNINYGDEITYKILTNVYSYDHVVSALKEENQELYSKIRLMEDSIEEIKKQINM